jgi:hypothetical protein
VVEKETEAQKRKAGLLGGRGRRCSDYYSVYHSVYLRYWYKSTNTDAEAASAVLRRRSTRISTLSSLMASKL